MVVPNQTARNVASSVFTAVKVAIGASVGGIVGLLVGFYLPLFACMAIDSATGSQFIQVGWIACFATVPGGFILGVMLGEIGIFKRPRLFGIAVVPILSVQGAYYYLSEVIHEPRSYTVKLSGEKGRRFVGNVRADGDMHALKGNLPAEFEFRALSVDFAFTLVESRRGDEIRVEVIVDGISKAGPHSDVGVGGEYSSFGFAEWAGGTSVHTWVMEPAGAAELRK